MFRLPDFEDEIKKSDLLVQMMNVKCRSQIIYVYNSHVRFIDAASGGCVNKMLFDGDKNNKAGDAENPK